MVGDLTYDSRIPIDAFLGQYTSLDDQFSYGRNGHDIVTMPSDYRSGWTSTIEVRLLDRAVLVQSHT